MRERPISFVPKSALLLLMASLALQIGWNVGRPASQSAPSALPAPPSLIALNIASFGEPIALAKMLMLYVQSFDRQAGVDIPFRNLNYGHLSDWLTRVLELDPTGQYPLFAASRIYAEVEDQARQRQMLDLIHQQFLLDPDRRWPWMAHAAIIAKHRLKDLALARDYARAIRVHATGKDVPDWAKQMEIFILQDMNELESAKVLIGGLLNSGQIKDPHEIRFLQEKLDALERHTKAKP
jgi:hypothetical protein